MGKGGALGDLSASTMKNYEYLAWILEALAIVAVNVYMLLSGFFLVESSFKLKRLLSLLLQVWFYSIGVGLAAAAFGYLPWGEVNIYYLLFLFLPILKKHYWFMTAYVFLYLFIPFLSAGIRHLTKKQLQMTIILMLIYFSGIKSLLPIVLDTDSRGYDCIWYVCVFLVAAYIRLYGLPFFKNKRRSIAVYLGAATGIFLFTMAFRLIYLKTGRLQTVLDRAYDYNHLLVLAASVGLFYLFFHMKIKSAKAAAFICKISPYTLGVYLLHEHVAVRYEW